MTETHPDGPAAGPAGPWPHRGAMAREARGGLLVRLVGGSRQAGRRPAAAPPAGASRDPVGRVSAGDPAADPVARPDRPAAGAPSLAATAPRAAVAPPPPADLALLLETAEHHPFAHYDQIARIRGADPDGPEPADATPPRGRLAAAPPPGRRGRIAAAPDVAEAARIAAAGAGPAAAPARPPLSRYMTQLRDALPDIAGTDRDCPYAAARFAAWYATEGAGRLRGTAPLAPETAAFLAAEAGDPWRAGPRLTRLAAQLPALAVSPEAGAMGPEAALHAAERWLAACDAFPAMDAALAPASAVSALTDVPPAGGGAPFPLGAWLVAVHARSPAYRARYDIATPAGRVGFVFDMLLHHATVPMRRLAFNAEAVAWFAAPADGAVDGLGRLELLVAIEAGWLPRLSRLPEGEARAVIRARFRAQACRAFPALAAFSTLDHATWRAGDAMLEVAGMARSATGLGQNLWMTVSALDMLGLEVLVRDSEAAFEALAPAETSAAIGVHLGEARAPRPAASVPPGDCRPGTPGGSPAGPLTRLAPRRKALILHLNADAAPQALCHPLYDRHPDLWAIGFLLWELEALPRAHALALDLLDEIWCPTRFLAEIYARHTGTPVHTVGKAIALPEPAVVARHRFGLVPDDTVFLVTFDFHSSVERKNPLAALRAFQRAFGCPPARGAVRGPAGPRLVIKTTPPVAGHWGDPNGMWPAIVAAAERDPRIVLVTEHLPFTSLIGLVAMADALVSPHRAEGFGYMPAYALALERPVIATDYGGSRDFVTAETGYPVAWSPRALAPGESILPLAGAFWADVDVDAMARAMAAVAAAPEAAATRAAAGRRLIETEYSRAAQAARYRARLTASGILP